MIDSLRSEMDVFRSNGPTGCGKWPGCTAAVLVLFASAGCDRLFEDNGTHLAYVLERGARELRNSQASELAVQYTTLDNADEPYYVEVTPTFPAGAEPSSVPNSYLVVSGKTSGGTSYHNRFIVVPRRFYVRKAHGGATELILHKDADRISIVDLR